MKLSISIIFFILSILLILFFLPLLAGYVADQFILPKEKIGNIGNFTDGTIAIHFLGLNNSYIYVNRTLMEKDSKMVIFSEIKEIPDQKFDCIVVGDSFTHYNNGLFNEFSRKGNLTTFIINKYILKKNIMQIVENLFSSGFFRASDAKILILENAGRNPIDEFYKNISNNDCLVTDKVTLKLWLLFGGKIDQIINGIHPNSTVNLLSMNNVYYWNRSSPFNLVFNDDPVRKATFNGEPALFEHPFPNESSTAHFSKILLAKNSSFIAKVGLDPHCWEKGQPDGAGFEVVITDDDGTSETVFSKFVSSPTKFQLIAVPLDHYAGKAVNLTLVTYSGKNANRDWAYWINPTIINATLLNDNERCINLLDTPIDYRWNHSSAFLSAFKTEPIKKTTFNSEPALFEHPLPNDYGAATFSKLKIYSRGCCPTLTHRHPVKYFF